MNFLTDKSCLWNIKKSWKAKIIRWVIWCYHINLIKCIVVIIGKLWEASCRQQRFVDYRSVWRWGFKIGIVSPVLGRNGVIIF